jgi:hypothetical protein
MVMDGGNFVSLAGGNVCCLCGDGNCEWKTREEEESEETLLHRFNTNDSSSMHSTCVATFQCTFTLGLLVLWR